MRRDRDVALQERALVRHDGPREVVSALVLLGVRCSRRPKEGEAKNVSAARVAVLALRQDRDTVPELAEVGVLRTISQSRHAKVNKRGWIYLVAAHFELGHVPSGVLVGRPLDVAKLSLVRREVVLDVKRNFKLKELVALMPVHLSVETEE